METSQLIWKHESQLEKFTTNLETLLLSWKPPYDFGNFLGQNIYFHIYFQFGNKSLFPTQLTRFHNKSIVSKLTIVFLIDVSKLTSAVFRF